MRRRTVLIVSLVVAAAVLGGLLLSTAGAGVSGNGYGPRMMGGYYGHRGYGPGMTYGHRTGMLLIRHQRAHCHTWSLNGGPFRASQWLSLHTGSTLTVINMDVMPHRLVELAGPKVSMRNGTTMPMLSGYLSRLPGLMNHMGASAAVRFSEAGTYRFRTRAGEDYVAGTETTGRDNVLTLTVTVR